MLTEAQYAQQQRNRLAAERERERMLAGDTAARAALQDRWDPLIRAMQEATNGRREQDPDAEREGWSQRV